MPFGCRIVACLPAPIAAIIKAARENPAIDADMLGRRGQLTLRQVMPGLLLFATQAVGRAGQNKLCFPIQLTRFLPIP